MWLKIQRDISNSALLYSNGTLHNQSMFAKTEIVFCEAGTGLDTQEFDLRT